MHNPYILGNLEIDRYVVERRLNGIKAEMEKQGGGIEIFKVDLLKYKLIEIPCKSEINVLRYLLNKSSKGGYTNGIQANRAKHDLRRRYHYTKVMERNRSLMRLGQINQVIDWTKVDNILKAHYSVGNNKDGADAFPHLCC